MVLIATHIYTYLVILYWSNEANTLLYILLKCLCMYVHAIPTFITKEYCLVALVAIIV